MLDSSPLSFGQVMFSRPAFASPLSPRSVNQQTSPPSYTYYSESLFPSMPLSPPQTPSKNSPRDFSRVRQTRAASQRAFQSRRPQREELNPLNRTAEQRTLERRNNFLANNRARREQNRWTSRGDQILRQDFIDDHRNWMVRIHESAPELGIDEEDEVMEHLDQSNVANQISISQQVSTSQKTDPMETSQSRVNRDALEEEAELEALLKAEQEELEAQLDLQIDVDHDHTHAASTAWHCEPSSPSRYGSDDGDYDDLFASLLENGSSQMDIS